MPGPFTWLKENASLREHALGEVDLGDKALPDALFADPLKLIDFGKAMVIEAVKRDAPEGVVEGLMLPIRRMVRFKSEIDRYRHVTATLYEAQGLRERSELEPVFEQALATAPDDANKQKLQAALDVLRASKSVDELVVEADEVFMKANGGTTEFSPSDACILCCGLGCLVCIEIGCVQCCVFGCITCYPS